MSVTRAGETEFGTEPVERNIDLKNFFLVRARKWDPRIGDFSTEYDKTMSKRFGEFVNANDYFDSVEHAELAGAVEPEIKLELIHSRFGTEHMVRSKILFPR